MRHNADSLLSALRFYGEDITNEQYEEIMSYVDELPEKEQGRFLDLSRS